MFVPLNHSLELWKFIDACGEKVRTTYWKNVRAVFWHIPVEEKVEGIKYLLEFKRFFSALEICGLQPELFPNNLLIEVLERVAMDKTDEDKQFNGHRANRILEELDERKDVSKDTFIKLELLYLPILTSQNTSRRPTVLYEELQKNADFFNEVLSWVYIADDKEVQKVEAEGLSKEQISIRADRGYELLQDWNLVPGRNASGKIDEVILLKWIEQARDLASKTGRLDQADMHIGKMFSLQPEKDEDWPDDEICAIIEKINTERLKKEFAVGLQNKRSSSVRGVFDGGKIERDHSTFFKSLFDKLKNKYPNVAKIFLDLSKRYENHAMRMDQEAEATRLDY